jgi:hypothetical protein
MHKSVADDSVRHTSSSLEPPPSAQLSPTSRRTPIKSIHPPAAALLPRAFFDPWNSSSTGHQRSENRLTGSTSWRTSRSLKLAEQFKGGLSSGARVADTVGAGSANFGKTGTKTNGNWEQGATGLRTGQQKSLSEIWGASKAATKTPSAKAVADATPNPHSHVSKCSSTPPESVEGNIFAGLCFYVNGSTAPLVSDHKLKHLLATHGAKYSIALSRRNVTHVILGTVSAQGGAGGGLAATKLQKEIARTGSKAVKHVTAEW